MTQTFSDLARERTDAKRSLSGFLIGTFAETTVQILREHMSQHSSRPALPGASRPMAVTVLAILATVGGVGVVLGTLAGAILVHGLASLDVGDAVRVIPGIALAAVYLAFARGAWVLKTWGWTLGVVAAVGTIAYLSAILAVEWAELVRDAPPLAWVSLLVIVAAAVSLTFWFRPGVRTAFRRD